MPNVTVRTKEGVAKFARAGLHFSREHSSHEVTDEQLAALQAETMLEVTVGAAKHAAKAKPDADPDETPAHGRHKR